MSAVNTGMPAPLASAMAVPTDASRPAWMMAALTLEAMKSFTWGSRCFAASISAEVTTTSYPCFAASSAASRRPSP